MSFFSSNPPGAPAGSGAVGNLSGSTDNAVARFDGTTGQLIQNSLVTIDDSGVMTVPTLKAIDIITTGDNVIVLNDDVIGTPSEDAGVEVERGISLNAQLLWLEGSDRWAAGIDGSLSNIIREIDLAQTSGPSGASLVGFDDSSAALGATTAQDAIVALDTALDTHTLDNTIHYTQANIDHTAILNVGTNSHAAIDTHISTANAHIADTSIHYTQANIDHTAILNVGVNSHAQIDTQIGNLTTHIANNAIHFTQANIDHTAILNIGVNNHAQIDTAITNSVNHIADSSIHFTQANIDHTSILNIGVNSHAQIDTAISNSVNHIADSSIHFTQASIDHTAIANIGTNSHAAIDIAITASTNHIADNSIHFTESSIDHTAITNIGVNSHAQIDTAITNSANHIADSSIHFPQGSIDHTAILNIGTNSHAQIDSHIASIANPHAVTATQVGKDTAQWNADRIQGVTVDDTNIADKALLQYISGSGNLEYVSDQTLILSLLDNILQGSEGDLLVDSDFNYLTTEGTF